MVPKYGMCFAGRYNVAFDVVSSAESAGDTLLGMSLTWADSQPVSDVVVLEEDW